MSTDDSKVRELKPKNPGYAGYTGEFELTEAEIRGTDYVGERPKHGGHAAVAGTLPYQIFERSPEAPLFEGEYAERLEKVLSRYPDRQAALLPALHMAQEIRGYLSPESMDEVAKRLDLPPAYVRGVTTFYTMYNLRPLGRYLIQVCTNISCNLCGGEEVLHAFLEHCGVDMGDVSENGLWTVIEVECLGACGFPTVVQINEKFYENVKPADVPGILQRLEAESTSAGMKNRE